MNFLLIHTIDILLHIAFILINLDIPVTENSNFVKSERWNVLKTSLLSDNDIKSNADIFVAEIDGNIAGSIVLFPTSIQAYDWNEDVQEYPEIHMLSVNPDIRGKGVGRALVENCLQVAKQQNNKTTHKLDFIPPLS